jgi:adenosylcobinamide-phosphate synthase
MVAGYLLDRAVGDPRRWHPVAGYGRFASAVQRRTYAPTTSAGVRFAAVSVGVPVALAAVATLATRRRPLARFVVTTAVTWAALGGESLRREAVAMAESLEDGDLAAARSRLGNLCGRDPSTLDEGELARATVESVAENTSDAEVGPLVWGALAGVPGIVGYRAINTLDAMVGHRNERYARFGSASARADDVVNLLPSRFTAALAVATASASEASAAGALGVWLRDGNQHPSPNSGQCEAAFAGALGVRLGGRNVYFGRSEERPALGDGEPPRVADIRRAARLSGAIGRLALLLTAGHVLARPLRKALARRTTAREVRTAVAGRAHEAAAARRAHKAAAAGRAREAAVAGRARGAATSKALPRRNRREAAS